MKDINSKKEETEETAAEAKETAAEEEAGSMELSAAYSRDVEDCDGSRIRDRYFLGCWEDSSSYDDDRGTASDDPTSIKRSKDVNPGDVVLCTQEADKENFLRLGFVVCVDEDDDNLVLVDFSLEDATIPNVLQCLRSNCSGLELGLEDSYWFIKEDVPVISSELNDFRRLCGCRDL